MQETCGPIYETSCLEWTDVNGLVFFFRSHTFAKYFWSR
jgi:hypothetical protein